MNDMPTLGGEAQVATGPGEGVYVVTETQIDRDARHAAMMRMAEPRVTVTDASGRVLPAPPLPHSTEYVTTQTLPPFVIGMLRGVYLGIFGAVGGLLTGLQLGSRDPGDLAWGALIGFCLGFLGRGAEAVIVDTPKATSTTEKV